MAPKTAFETAVVDDQPHVLAANGALDRLRVLQAAAAAAAAVPADIATGAESSDGGLPAEPPFEVDAVDALGNAPIVYSCKAGSIEVTEWLVGLCADINKPGHAGLRARCRPIRVLARRDPKWPRAPPAFGTVGCWVHMDRLLTPDSSKSTVAPSVSARLVGFGTSTARRRRRKDVKLMKN